MCNAHVARQSNGVRITMHKNMRLTFIIFFTSGLSLSAVEKKNRETDDIWQFCRRLFFKNFLNGMGLILSFKCNFLRNTDTHWKIRNIFIDLLNEHDQILSSSTWSSSQPRDYISSFKKKSFHKRKKCIRKYNIQKKCTRNLQSFSDQLLKGWRKSFSRFIFYLILD